MEALKDYKVKKIVVWGIDGVGKTTLVKEVDHDVEGFDRVVMVIVSETPNIARIQMKIFLIIVDNLWNQWGDEDLKTIGIPLVENGKVTMEVAKECEGLPLAIVPLARALRGKTLNGWKLAYHKISSSRLMDIEDVPKQRKEMHT
ncbi:hypothetical protein Gotur_016445 [Gossypium turneri]